MSWPDMMTPWAAEPALPLLDRAGPAAEIGFCADCRKAGRRCPDHREMTP